MKHMVFGVTSAILVVLFALILTTIEGGTTRDNEISDSLHAVLKSAVADVMERREYTIEEDEELVADLTAQLMRRLNTNDKNMKLDVDVAGVDAKRGLLAVHVKESFTYPNGRLGTVEDSACVVLEREKERCIYEISFTLKKADAKALHVPKTCRVFRITEGENMKAPKSVYGREVTAWKKKGTRLTFSPEELRKSKVTDSAVYVAVLAR